MKILVLSLLRVGDLIMHSALIKALRQKYPSAEVQLLVNEVSQKYAETLIEVSNVIVFPRNQLQKNLVEENRPILRAHGMLKTFVQNLNKNNYDLVLNLTHNQLSARLMDLISAKEKRGVRYEKGLRSPLENNWGSYFNNQFSTINKAQFHYLENLTESLGLPLPDLHSSTMTKGHRILIQVLTSDEKKNWPLKNFVELISLLRTAFPEKMVTVLGAPGEEELIREKFINLPGIDFKFDRWSALDKTISEASLLITGDTSVQHFAAKAGIPVLSLFMGSANPTKTAPYLAGSVIIQTRAVCSPCLHSAKCTKSSIECAHEISVDEVFSVASAILKETNLPKIHNKLLQVQKRMNGRFHLVNAAGGSEMINFQSAFEQSVWEIYLNRGHLEQAGPFGSFSHILMEEYARPFAIGDAKEFLLNRLQKCEMDQVFAEELHHEILDSIKKGFYFNEVLNSMRSYLISYQDSADYFYQVHQSLQSEDLGFVKAKALSLAIQESSTLLKIEHKLIRTLLTEIKERELRYGKGFRATLDSSASAT